MTVGWLIGIDWCWLDSVLQVEDDAVLLLTKVDRRRAWASGLGEVILGIERFSRWF
jgi:hypothetical protein